MTQFLGFKNIRVGNVYKNYIDDGTHREKDSIKITEPLVETIINR